MPNFSFQNKEHEYIQLGHSEKANFVFLHGAGTGTKERILSIADYLAKQGNTIFAFDQSGAGLDSVNLNQTSLAKRIEEAKFAIENFGNLNNLYISGASMGGYVAIQMLRYFDIQSLILFCPALYDKSVYHLQFDSGFTHAIRQSESWRNTDALELLQNYQGKLLIVIGSDDEVIPQGVIELIVQHSGKASKKEIMYVPSAPHKIMTWLANEPGQAKIVANKVLEYLQ